MYIECTPAYGKDYKTAKEAKAAWTAGKDFIIQAFMHPYDGKPVNKDHGDARLKIMLRFCKLTKVCKV